MERKQHYLSHEYRKAEFRDKRWAECPPELSADFALAMARDLAREYGTGAP